MEIKLDLCAAKGGACQTQPKWNTDYNSGEIPGVFAAVPDYCADFVGRRKWIRSVREDMRESLVCTSTVLFVHGSDLCGSVVHHYGSKKIIPVRFDDLFIPDFSLGISLEKLIESEDGLWFTWALLNKPGEGKQRLKKCVEEWSGVPASSTYVRTPNQESRAKNPIRVVRFGYFVRFDIDCEGSLSDSGRVRGVQY